MKKGNVYGPTCSANEIGVPVKNVASADVRFTESR